MENVQLIKSPIPFIMMLVYIAVVMVMAWYQGFSKMARERKKNQTFEDYMTAGKSRNAVIVFLITIVTFYSGTTFTGRVGFFYNFGVAGLGSVIVCSATGMVMFFLSEKVWPIAKKYRLSTLPDIMELRYQSRWVKFFVSLIIVCFNIIWLITEIRTLGLAVNLASGGAIATEIGSAIAFAIIILYVATGGVHSVSMVDSFSACVMLGGSLVVLGYLVNFFFNGSFVDMFQSADTAAQMLYAGQTQESIFVLANSGNYNLPYWISNIVLGTIVMLVYPSNFMSICLAKDVREVKKSSLATSASGIWLSIYAIFGVVVLGAVAKGYMVSAPEAGILELCSMAGSPLMLGLVCTFILAAALGTLDSTLISLSGLVSNDLITNMVKLKNHEPTIGADGGETLATIDTRVQRDAKKEVRMTRIIVVVLGVIAFCFSLTDLPLLTLLTDMATNGMSLVVPTVAAGLFWKKATPQGAIASMVTAEAVYLGLYASGVRYVWGGFFLGFPAIAVGIVVMIVVSLATQDKYYKAHAAQQGVFEDFFVRGRVSAWIRENMGTKAAK